MISDNEDAVRIRTLVSAELVQQTTSRSIDGCEELRRVLYSRREAAARGHAEKATPYRSGLGNDKYKPHDNDPKGGYSQTEGSNFPNQHQCRTPRRAASWGKDTASINKQRANHTTMSASNCAANRQIGQGRRLDHWKVSCEKSITMIGSPTQLSCLEKWSPYADTLQVAAWTHTRGITKPNGKDDEEKSAFHTKSRCSYPSQQDKSLPLFKTLKKCTKKGDFRWTTEAEEASLQLIAQYSSTSHANRNSVQTPVYFVSKALKETEINYSAMEKLILALVFAPKELVGTLPHDQTDAPGAYAHAAEEIQFEMVSSYRRFSSYKPWLRCVRPIQADYVLREIHAGSCSMHSGPRSVVARALRSGYYWPTMHRDARDMIKKCKDCQVHRPILRQPQQELTPITSPWPFHKWGIDIAGPFPVAAGGLKFLIVAIDYFTKWIEAKSRSATISGNQVKRFVWDNIVCHFGLPGEIVSDNGKQFCDNPFKDWCSRLSITQRFASVKHPQTNGLVERANRSLGEGSKARKWLAQDRWGVELSNIL
ncbi:reverse transcriptase domain-containing protein [Tanacetum coccineum]|uniref:Reverse transcriptase domain-containing protein n=1 Tax=Tanacetum coccineum TaxID=301880 RepID=A0ABQ5JBE2_9ASTR